MGSGETEKLVARLQKLEALLAAQQETLDRVEKLAQKKGMLMQMVTQYGVPFAVWYATLWAGSLFGIYTALELEIISFQETLQPLLVSYGMEAKIDPSMGNFIIAFIVNECAEPVRFPLLLATFLPMTKLIRRMRGVPAAAGATGAVAAAGTAAAAAGT